MPSAFRGWGTGGGETAPQTAWLSPLTWARLVWALSLPLVFLPPRFFVSFKILCKLNHTTFSFNTTYTVLLWHQATYFATLCFAPASPDLWHLLPCEVAENIISVLAFYDEA